LGIAISAAIALSSTSFVTNFMAAVMLRVTRPFKVGDFIKVGGLFGKVTERGLFDTEIQTENRELIAIPNATFITEAVIVARSSGVIISTTLSLGYDIDFAIAEPLMLQAAAETGLSDPYIHIVSLNDFSISYRVCGLLTDLESILTAKSKLHHELIKSLHGADLEIASPTIARHITQPAEQKIMPQTGYIEATENAVVAEDIVFDKANEIARLEENIIELRDRVLLLKETKDSETQSAPLLAELARAEEALQALRNET
jgi:small-conductance mechanosensitive channel